MLRRSAVVLPLFILGAVSAPALAQDARRVTMQAAPNSSETVNLDSDLAGLIKESDFQARLEILPPDGAEMVAYFEPPAVGAADGTFMASPRGLGRDAGTSGAVAPTDAPEPEISLPLNLLNLDPQSAGPFQLASLSTPEEFDSPRPIVEVPVENSILDAIPSPPKAAAVAVIHEQQRRVDEVIREQKRAREIGGAEGKGQKRLGAPAYSSPRQPVKAAHPVVVSPNLGRSHTPSLHATPSGPRKMDANDVAAVRAFSRF